MYTHKLPGQGKIALAFIDMLNLALEELTGAEVTEARLELPARGGVRFNLKWTFHVKLDYKDGKGEQPGKLVGYDQISGLVSRKRLFLRDMADIDIDVPFIPPFKPKNSLNLPGWCAMLVM